MSNRAPVTVHIEEGEPRIALSVGGLATGLRGPHERSHGLWIGWPGDTGELDESQDAIVRERLDALRIVPVSLSADEITGFYEGIANEVLWPVFHSLLGQMPLSLPAFDVYERVNARFADTVAEHHRPGDTIWVHDYQLMLVPALVRARLPEAEIGFFLHIPFPPAEVFRALPWREALLTGVLGADLVGFHAASYMRHFASTVTRVLGAASDVEAVAWQQRRIRLGVFPMGIDAAYFGAVSREAEVVAEARSLGQDGRIRILVGIDRLDYTKGIPRRLLAYEKLLRDHEEFRERVQLVQVSVPSRANVEAYQDLRAQVDELVGRINGTFATPRWTPVQYLYRSLSPRELLALYLVADVMLVTPIRDGMNLVAKEFVACRADERGVLVLSEFTGASTELGEALHVNPYDIEGTAEAYHRALIMPADERDTRMRGLRRRVIAYDVHRWVRSFLAALHQRAPAPPPPVESPPEALLDIVHRARGAPQVVLLLDYDGTLVPFAPAPDLAAPDHELITLLGRLGGDARFEVHVISGRSRETLGRWLGALPLSLYAEHGAWSRPRGASEWSARDVPPMTWREPAIAILDDFAARTPGALVEEKTFGLAWHYRMAEPEYGTAQANELKLHLTTMLANAPVEVLPGDKVIELRPHGVHKGGVVSGVVERAPEGSLVLAMGDDRTDEDLFAALPPSGIAIHVGSAPSRAAVRVRDVAAARRLLHALAAAHGS